LRSPSENTSAIWRTGIIPTLAALIITAVQIIERAQVEWAASCAMPGICETVQQGEFLGELLGWLPAFFVFAILHAALREYPPAINPSWPDRSARLVVFAASSIYPHLGWYMALAGIAAGFLAAITVIGLIVAPVAGILGGTWFGGLLLGFIAGPSFTADWPIWRRVLLRYANAAALAGVVLVAGYGLFDLQYSVIAGAYPWLDALGLLMFTAIACCIIWIWTRDAHQAVCAALSKAMLVQAFGALGVVVAVIVAPTMLAIEAGMKPLNAVGGSANPAVAFVRGYKPPNTTPLQLAGLSYIGARSNITLRSSERRDHIPGGRAISWRMTPPQSGQEEIHVVADNGGAKRELPCLAVSEGKRLCFRDSYVARDRITEPVQRAMTFQSEDAFEDFVDLPDSYFGIRFDPGLMRNGTALADGPRRFCRIGLVNVTSARLSMHQIVPCNEPWKETAIRLRAHVESLFKPSGNP
jgi:hypothetical protein